MSSSPSPIDSYLHGLYERRQGDRSGAVADYIPPLALADPDWFGIGIATTDGHCPFVVGEMFFSAGDPATDVYLLLAGEVTVEIEREGHRRRLATLTPGLAFGEVALADVPSRPVSVRGERAGECLVLSLEAFDQLPETDAALQAALMPNMLASFYETIGRTAREAGSTFARR